MPEPTPETFPVQPTRPAGVCIPFAEKVKEWPPIMGDEKLVQKVWEDTDGLAYMWIWQMLVSF